MTGSASIKSATHNGNPPATSSKKWTFAALCYVAATLSVFAVAVPALAGLPAPVALSMALLYLCSHALRALRLALLSPEMLGISARTAAAVHFATAPFSLLFPLKLGELFRFLALWRMSRNAIHSFIVLLIDRMYDSLFLLPIVLILSFQSGAPAAFVLLTLFAAALPLVIVVLGPSILSELQRYIVANHNGRFVLEALGKIDALRRLVILASQVARRRTVEFSMISFLIWLCEISFCLLLIPGVSKALELLGARMVSSWWAGGQLDLMLTISLQVTTVSLLAIWPVFAAVLFMRWRLEPSRI